MTTTARLTAHADLATSLALLSDRELAELVASGTPAGAGIGGRATLVEVGGRRVFVKQVPVTDLELRPENLRSTADLHRLPVHCHYGIGSIGSPGYGAWRELAVHTMTTNWVLSGRFAGFPLLHHWRVLPDGPRPLPEELADVDSAVAYWGPSVHARIEAIRTAPAGLTLFLECLPHTLHDWLGPELRTDRAESACAFVAAGLKDITAFLRERRLLHFDVHFRNILTDGRHLYLTDFGLALSSRFRLAVEEREFFERQRDYDRVYSTTHLVNWLVADLYRYDRRDREAFIRACADGARPEGVPEAAAEIVSRHAPLTVVVNDFHRRFQEEGTSTPYPYDDVRRA